MASWPPTSRAEPAGPAAASRAFGALWCIVHALDVNARVVDARSGVSFAQLFVLRQLGEHPVASLHELAERTATHSSSVSVVVQKLVARGLVRRDERTGEQRGLHLSLTAAGRRVLASAPPSVQRSLLDGLGRLSDAEREALAHLLDAWLEQAGIAVVAPPMFAEEDAG